MSDKLKVDQNVEFNVVLPIAQAVEVTLMAERHNARPEDVIAAMVTFAFEEIAEAKKTKESCEISAFREDTDECLNLEYYTFHLKGRISEKFIDNIKRQPLKVRQVLHAFFMTFVGSVFPITLNTVSNASLYVGPILEFYLAFDVYHDQETRVWLAIDEDRKKATRFIEDTEKQTGIFMSRYVNFVKYDDDGKVAPRFDHTLQALELDEGFDTVELSVEDIETLIKYYQKRIPKLIDRV